MMVPSMMMEAEVRTRWMRARVRTRAVRERGGRDIIAGSTGSTPRDWAGGPSMRISVEASVFRPRSFSMRIGQLAYPQDLHRVQRVLEAEKGTEED